jgi:hypothetical protein
MGNSGRERQRLPVTGPRRRSTVTWAQASAATLLGAPLLLGVAVGLGRFSFIVLFDFVACCVLSATLFAIDRLSRRPVDARTSSGRIAASRNVAGLVGLAGLVAAVLATYSVQIAGPPRSGEANAAVPESRRTAQGADRGDGATNITIHCESGKVNVGSRRSR